MSAIKRVTSAQKIKVSLIKLPYWQQAQNIAAYLPFHGEIDVFPIIEYAWKQGKNCYLPILNKNQSEPLLFEKFTKDSLLQKNKFGIPEPKLDMTIVIPAKDLDLAIVPLVGFDQNCNRLGQGCAYYDRAFAFKKDLSKNAKPILIGVAYELQKLHALEPKSWDVPMDLIITEKKVRERAQHNR